MERSRKNREKSKPRKVKKRKKKKIIADLEVQLAEAKSLFKNYEDCGPLYDCIVYRDEKSNLYRAIIDSSESGDLTSITKGMCDYRIEHEYSTFSSSSLMNYSV